MLSASKEQEIKESCLQALLQTEKKNIEDRFIRSRRWSEKKRRSQLHINCHDDLGSSDSKDSYVTCLSRSLHDSPDSLSLRNFTLDRLNSDKKQTTKFKGQKTLRKQSIVPFRKYKVIGWKDNYYTNLLDWSYNNFICAGYLNDLALYNMQIDDEFQSSLCKAYSIGLHSQVLTSLKSSPYETKIALGFTNGCLKVFDYFKQKQIFHSYHHSLRIATISWSDNVIITGSKDQHIKIFDIRQKKSIETSAEFQRSHTQEICGIKQKNNYLASGGNDNKVYVYDLRAFKVLDNYGHQAAVKGITWIGDHELITGGGTADKKIKFWRDGKGIVKQIDTGSQVCSLLFSENTQEIISCQGFSLNQIIIWSKNAERQFTFHGHSSRVLYSALSPTGQFLASGAGDQNLKVWKLFPQKYTKSTLLFKDIR